MIMLISHGGAERTNFRSISSSAGVSSSGLNVVPSGEALPAIEMGLAAPGVIGIGRAAPDVTGIGRTAAGATEITAISGPGVGTGRGIDAGSGRPDAGIGDAG